MAPFCSCVPVSQSAHHQNWTLKQLNGSIHHQIYYTCVFPTVTLLEVSQWTLPYTNLSNQNCISTTYDNAVKLMVCLVQTWLARPCRGPARPFMAAAKARYGSDRALPTKWLVWALTLPPSWSLQDYKKKKITVQIKSCRSLHYNSVCWTLLSNQWLTWARWPFTYSSFLNSICALLHVQFAYEIYSPVRTDNTLYIPLLW